MVFWCEDKFNFMNRFFSPEQAAINNDVPIKPVINEAYKLATKKLQRIDIGKFKEEDFGPGVQADAETARNLKMVFREKMKGDRERQKLAQYATVLEAIIYQQIELSDWFGPEAETKAPTEYDDFINQMDVIVEFKDSDLILALDTTLCRNEKLEYKFMKIMDRISAGQLSEIKYYPGEDTIGRRKNVPLAIVGADTKTIEELSELWLNKENKALAAHPFSLQILEEIIFQLKSFAEFAELIKKDQVAQKYRQLLSKLEEIYQQKKTEIKDTGARDQIYYKMEQAVEKIFK